MPGFYVTIKGPEPTRRYPLAALAELLQQKVRELERGTMPLPAVNWPLQCTVTDGSVTLELVIERE